MLPFVSPSDSLLMKINSVLLTYFLAGFLLFSLQPQASVRMTTTDKNEFSSRTTFNATTGWALPEDNWTVGIWDNNFQGDGGILINAFGSPKAAPTFNLWYDDKSGRYYAGGKDSEGHTFGSGNASGFSGTTAEGYPGRVSGKFSPRLHIIRRRDGYSEYLVAEAGHAPVLVYSEKRPFGPIPAGNWHLGCHSGWGSLYDGDLEGFFFAETAVSNRAIALMAAGQKPSSLTSVRDHLTVYFPLESAELSNSSNPLVLSNQGSELTIGLERNGDVAHFNDGPMLRGATEENNQPSDITEPTNVVALNSFQPFQIIRHVNGNADVTFTGFDYGTGMADIEIRFIDVEHSASTSWQTLVADSPGDGTMIEATIPVPKGYWKTIEVRRVNSSSGTGNSNRPNRTWSRWAVGEVVCIWGDSLAGGIQSNLTADIVEPNGFTAKYPTTNVPKVRGDENPLCNDMWNFLRGSGMGGGTQGENLLANTLSEASQCCVGISVYWAGATDLSNWSGRTSTVQYDKAKAYALTNNGLNKPNIITWVGNLANARWPSNASLYYEDLNSFRDLLNEDLGSGTWKLVLMSLPIIYAPDTLKPAGAHILRDSCQRWTKDNADCSLYAGVAFDHQTGADGVHYGEGTWDIMGPRWGNAVGFLRDKENYANPSGGEIVNFYRSGGEILVQVELHSGTALSLKHTSENISGFTVSSDDFETTIPLASVTLEEGSMIRLTPVSPLPPGPLKLRYLYGNPGSGTSENRAPENAEQAGVDNILYINTGPENVVAVQPIWGAENTHWSLEEGASLPSL